MKWMNSQIGSLEYVFYRIGTNQKEYLLLYQENQQFIRQGKDRESIMEETDSLSKLDAEEDWNRARRKMLYQRVVCFFKQRSVDLLSFGEVRSRLHLVQKMARGLQEIPLERIRGSVGRFDDFTSAFLPRKGNLQDHWERVDIAMRAGKTPPIEFFQPDQFPFQRDVWRVRFLLPAQETVVRSG